jgi:SynChlorMet cassette radical SAM/SPASM protein ScmF
MVRFEGLHLTVETNGVLCTPEMAKELAEAGDAFVAVSLDGSDAATHEWLRGVEGCFESSINGIRNLVSAGLKPQLIMSVMRRNREQIEPVVRLAEQLGAGSVKFNIVEPIARGERMHEEGETMSVKELIELGQWVERTLSDSTELRLVYDYPAAFHPLGRMLGGNRDGCCVCGILRIMGVLADGSYALCGIGEIVPELVLGHAAVDRLEDVWNKASLLQELREGLPGRLEGVCRECFMKGVCLGSCIAQNYYRCRNLWAPFWFCEEAEREGLFPETRRYRPDMLVQRHTLI